MNDIHELLPWYANRTLEPAETAAFESHLSGCDDCKAELALLEKMQARLEVHGEELLSSHPSPQQLVAALTAPHEAADLPAEVAAKVRRHVALCVSCAGEASAAVRAAASIDAGLARTASSGGPAATGTAPTPPAPRTLASRLLPWGWAVAAALLVLLIAVPDWTGSSGTTGVGRLNLIEAAERAGGAPSVVQVAPGAEMVYLIFPIDVDPEAFPASFEVLDSDQRLIHRDDSVRSVDLYRGLFLFLAVRRAEFPDGAYVARLTPGKAAGTPIEYRFRVTG